MDSLGGRPPLPPRTCRPPRPGVDPPGTWARAETGSSGSGVNSSGRLAESGMGSRQRAGGSPGRAGPSVGREAPPLVGRDRTGNRSTRSAARQARPSRTGLVGRRRVLPPTRHVFPVTPHRFATTRLWAPGHPAWAPGRASGPGGVGGAAAARRRCGPRTTPPSCPSSSRSWRGGLAPAQSSCVEPMRHTSLAASPRLLAVAILQTGPGPAPDMPCAGRIIINYLKRRHSTVDRPHRLFHELMMPAQSATSSNDAGREDRSGTCDGEGPRLCEMG